MKSIPLIGYSDKISLRSEFVFFFRSEFIINIGKILANVTPVLSGIKPTLSEYTGKIF